MIALLDGEKSDAKLTLLHHVSSPSNVLFLDLMSFRIWFSRNVCKNF